MVVLFLLLLLLLLWKVVPNDSGGSKRDILVPISKFFGPWASCKPRTLHQKPRNPAETISMIPKPHTLHYSPEPCRSPLKEL